MTATIKAQWPDSEHIAPVSLPAGDDRVTVNGRPLRAPCRILSEDEYQLLLAGFIAAGGKVAARRLLS
jgi:hypothetical protein